MRTFTSDSLPLSSRRFAPTTTYICLVERGPVDKIPGGPNIKVFIGVTVMVGLCAVPVFSKNQKRGHDLFSQEKPEAVVASTERLQREHYKKKREE